MALLNNRFGDKPEENTDIFDEDGNKIYIAQNSKRTSAAITDAFFFIILSIILIVFASNCIFLPLASATGAYSDEKYNEVLTKIENEQNKSSLYILNPVYNEKTKNQTNKYIPLNDDSVDSSYMNYFNVDGGVNTASIYRKTQEFYTVYLAGNPMFADEEYNKTKDKYTKYWYNVFILGLNDELGRYSEEELNARPKFIKDCNLFQFDENKENIAVIKPSLFGSDGSLLSSTVDSLKKYFVTNGTVAEASVSFTDANGKTNELTVKYSENIFDYSSYIWIYGSHDIGKENSLYNLLLKYQDMMKVHQNFQIVYPATFGFALSFIILYFIIPLIFKSGRTLGKKFNKVRVCRKNGVPYDITAHCLRNIVPLAVIVGVVLLGFNASLLIAIGVSFAVLIVDYVCLCYSKNNKAIHDFVASTIVIDDSLVKDKKTTVEVPQSYNNEVIDVTAVEVTEQKPEEKEEK